MINFFKEQYIDHKSHFDNEEYFLIMRDWHNNEGGFALDSISQKCINDTLKLNDVRRVLDAGCGEGSPMVFLAQQNPNTSFLGIDVSIVGIRMAKELAVSKSVANTNFKNLYLEKLDDEIKEEYFDFIYSISSIEHVENINLVIKNFYKLLRKGGLLFIRVENGALIDNIIKAVMKYLFHCHKIKKIKNTFVIDKNNESESHRHNFDTYSIPSDSLLSLLKKTGFQIDFFTTNRASFLKSLTFEKMPFWKRFLSYPILKFNFFPFIHLGATIVILAKKQ